MFYKDVIKNIMQTFLSADAYIDFLIWKRGSFEPEIELLPFLCSNDKLSIDVGAADGIYTTHLYKLSKECYAFEPRIDAYQRLVKMFSGTKKPINLSTNALSDFVGETTLKIFPEEYGRSTIEKENDLEKDGKVEYATVHVSRIDDCMFNEQVGFIKIDVEGHEEAVLRGAERVIAEDRPSFLIEIEERHKPGAINSTNAFLKKFGYKGFFYKDRQLVSINNFDLKVHQNYKYLTEGKEYYNNFIFVNANAFSKMQSKINVT